MSQVHGTPVLLSFKVNGATISAYRLVKPAAGNNSVALWDAVSALMIGVTQQQSVGATGTSVLVAVGGCAKLQAGASISAGAVVTGTTTGLGIADTTNGFSDTATSCVIPYAIGIALDAADTNSVFEVLIQPRNVRFDF